MVDMAHYAGLIAAGEYPNPVPYADFVTSTTHKSLRGPRGGIILMKAEHEKAINSAIFPGIQGGPLMHVIAGKAVAFKEALSPEFKTYQQQVVKNAKALAEALIARGLRIVSGRTESHVMLVDLRSKGLTGKEAEAILGQAHMTCNKNGIPNDPQKAFRDLRHPPRQPGLHHPRLQGRRRDQGRQPDRRRAGQPARRRDHRARQGRSQETDRQVSGLRSIKSASDSALPAAAPATMKCPFCQHEDTQVLDTRVSEEGDAIRRRRRCASATSVSPPTSGSSCRCRSSSRRTAAAPNSNRPNCAAA
jgi:hypothetical protein